MYGIADLDNCYCSCEKVFRPDLEGKPIVVLSNNDGCVVARSNEAKKMGIKEGTPYFQLAQLFPGQKIAVFSSNYELYGELTGRVVSIIRQETPAYFRYSIDECFMYLDGIELDKLQTWGENLHKRVKREVGLPISIGLAPNKTLAKIASKLAKKKSICTSRSFNGMISDKETLRTHIANYAARCAEKLRMQKTVATTVGVFVNTNAFREDLAQYWNFQETRLVTPTSSTIPIVQAAHDVLDRIFIQGYQYKKAGVIVMGISPDSPIQQDLFDLNAEQIQKMRRLDEVIDRINRMHGSETIVIGAQQYTQKNGKGKAEVFANAIKHDFRSPSPTTRWGEIMKLNAKAKKKEE